MLFDVKRPPEPLEHSVPAQDAIGEFNRDTALQSRLKKSGQIPSFDGSDGSERAWAAGRTAKRQRQSWGKRPRSSYPGGPNPLTFQLPLTPCMGGEGWKWTLNAHPGGQARM